MFLVLLTVASSYVGVIRTLQTEIASLPFLSLAIYTKYLYNICFTYLHSTISGIHTLHSLFCNSITFCVSLTKTLRLTLELLLQLQQPGTTSPPHPRRPPLSAFASSTSSSCDAATAHRQLCIMSSMTPSSPRLPSPPPAAEIQVTPNSPSGGPAATLQATEMEQSVIDAHSKRRIHPGTKASEMAAGPPVVPLNEVG